MIIVLAHPYGGDPTNLVRAKRWLQWVSEFAVQWNQTNPTPYVDRELAVEASWIPLCEVLPETEGLRRYGLRSTLQLLTRLGRGNFELWAFSRLSRGVTFECNAALYTGGIAWDLTGLGEVPPDEVFDPRGHPTAVRIQGHTPEWEKLV